MDLLYGNKRKLFKIVYKNHKKGKIATKTELSKVLNLTYQQVSDICKELYDMGLIVYVGMDFNPKLSSKGVDYFSSENGNWLSKNLIAILALIVSILAFVRTL